MLQSLKAVLVALAFAALLPAAAPAAAETPTQIINDYYGLLLKAMKNGKTLGYQGRFDLLEPGVDGTFNIPLMTQASVGAYWDTMSEAQRQALIEAFRQFTIANYAHNFDSYGGEQFETMSEKETPRKDVIVYSNIVKSDGDKVAINYLLRQDGVRYKVIDVFLDGSISQLATRRSEYTSLIRRDGVDALIQAIRLKADGLAN
jgi:phospholipid transport system substrate-binding protein